MPKLLTTGSGRPVEIREVSSLNRDELTNPFFMDIVKSISNERTPNREVNAKGTGAFGYFEVLNDVTKYTKAKVFEKVGKKTPIVVRLGTSQAENAGSDFEPLGLRGFSLKFYTEEGNLDFLNIQIPVFFFRDPMIFTLTARALRRNPKNFLKDFTAAFDQITLHPEALHAFLWMASEFGLPRGFRKMNGFPIQCYPLYNKHGDVYYARFSFLTEQGFDSFTLKEANDLGAQDPDFFIRDVYNAIETKHYPSWLLQMDVMPSEALKEIDYDPFDVTRLWKNGTYHSVTVGRIVLNRNVDNHYAQVERAAYNPANLVPGFDQPPDNLFRGRVVAYSTAQIHRLGINNQNIRVNRPRYHYTYKREGEEPTLDNMSDVPEYFPNSFNGPTPYVDPAKPDRRLVIRQTDAHDLDQAARFYKYNLRTEKQKKRLVDNIVDHIIRVPHPTQERFAELLDKTDKDLGWRFRETLARKKKETLLPNVVEEIPKARDEL